MVLTGNMAELMNRKLAEILREFKEEFYEKYQCSFSYGIVEVEGKDNNMTLEEILKNAQEVMHENIQKRLGRALETGKA